MQENIQKVFIFAEIAASELVSLNCPYEEHDPFHRQRICSQEVPRFFMSIRETFLNSIDLVVINESNKGSFKKWLGTFTMLLVEGSSKTVLFRHFLTTFLESVISEIQNLWGLSSASKYLKYKVDFKNPAENWEKVFCFWYNCIWIGIVKLSLLRTGYFSSAANKLTSSSKIFHVNKRDFFQLNWLSNDHWIW